MKNICIIIIMKPQKLKKELPLKHGWVEKQFPIHIPCFFFMESIFVPFKKGTKMSFPGKHNEFILIVQEVKKVHMVVILVSNLYFY